MNLIVIDDSFEGKADLNTQNPAGLSINIFKPSPTDFPAVKQVGDIVQFRHFRVRERVNYKDYIITYFYLYPPFRFNIMNPSFKELQLNGQLTLFSEGTREKDTHGKLFLSAKYSQKNLR